MTTEFDIKIIAEFIGDASYITCPQCCGYNADGCGYTETNYGLQIEYDCHECLAQYNFRWFPKTETHDEEMFNVTNRGNWKHVDVINEDYWDYVFCFDKLRNTILESERKFERMKTLMDYYDINYESNGYTIPQIYEDLKKNYVKKTDYILYNLGRHLFP